MADVGEVRNKATVDNSGVNNDIKDTESQFKESAKQIEKASDDANKDVAKDFEESSSKATSSWKNAGGAIAKGIGAAFAGVTAATGAGLAVLGKAGTDFSAQMETYQASFEVMTGDAEEAVRITEQLKETAAKTPFGMTDLADTTQLLMNYGLTASDAMNSMEMLGDISQGSADKLNRIAMAYGQMSSLGKVQLEDIKQMIEAGFNPLSEISKTTGESMESLYDRISDGALSVDEITASMERSTSAGGKYYQSMDKQSKTLSGQLATMQDNFASFAGEVTSGLAPAMTEAMEMVNEAMADPAAKDALTGLFDSLSDIVVDLLPILLDTFTNLMPFFQSLVEDVLPILVETIGVIAPLIADLVTAVLPIFMELLEALLPPLLEIIQTILPPLIELIGALLPIIQSIFALLEPIITLITGLLGPIVSLISDALTPLLEALQPIVDFIIDMFIPVLNYWAEIFAGVIGGVVNAISSYIQPIIDYLSAIVDFVTNVFTGNWEGAWNAVVNIFKAIWDGIVNIFKIPLNFLIDIINGFISGLNMLKIPDWVPGVGGFGINIPLIPRLKKGEDFVPEDFYPAYLDYGEAVLTKEQNIKFRALGGIEGMEAMVSGNFGGISQNQNFNITLTGDVKMDGFKVGTVVLRNLDDANNYV